MVNVNCDYRTYSEEWDKKLNKLLEEGELICPLKKYTLLFKLKRGVKVFNFFFFKKEVALYDTYEVWLGNKDSHYGFLYKFNGKRLPSELEYAAKQKTLQKLYALEKEVSYPEFKDTYK